MTQAPYSWQQPAWDQLIARQQSSNLPQSLLISGLRGVGKADFALELARTGLCRSSSLRSCGLCPSCQQIAAGSHPDLLILRRLEDKKEIVIDQIREFTQQIQLTPSQSQGRYALILDADQMNLASSNALLKTLEEPPGKVRILLTVSRLARVLPTIRSRCFQIHIPNPREDEARRWWAEQGRDAASFFVRRGHGPCVSPSEEGKAGKESGWYKACEQLQRQGDPLVAASAIDELDFEDFLCWWQERLLDQARLQGAWPGLRRMWDAIMSLRRQIHGNFNRLLALEGLFILYLQVVHNTKPAALKGSEQ